MPGRLQGRRAWRAGGAWCWSASPAPAPAGRGGSRRRLLNSPLLPIEADQYFYGELIQSAFHNNWETPRGINWGTAASDADIRADGGTPKKGGGLVRELERAIKELEQADKIPEKPLGHAIPDPKRVGEPLWVESPLRPGQVKPVYIVVEGFLLFYPLPVLGSASQNRTCAKNQEAVDWADVSPFPKVGCVFQVDSPELLPPKKREEQQRLVARMDLKLWLKVEGPDSKLEPDNRTLGERRAHRTMETQTSPLILRWWKDKFGFDVKGGLARQYEQEQWTWYAKFRDAQVANAKAVRPDAFVERDLAAAAVDPKELGQLAEQIAGERT